MFGLFAGIATIVYVGGASLLALRLLFAGMPTPAVFASQISLELVTSIGLTQILLPLLVVALVYLAFRILLGSADRTLIHGWWRWLAWTLIGTAILVVPGYWYHLAWHHSHFRTWISWPWWWTGLVFIIPAVTVLVALRIRQRLLTGTYKTRWTFNTPKALLPWLRFGLWRRFLVL